MNKKNPLFVVTEKGKTVEEAENIVDAMIKKLGLSQFVTTLKSILEAIMDSIITLMNQANSYAMLSNISALLEKFSKILEFLLKKVDPVLAFSVFMR